MYVNVYLFMKPIHHNDQVDVLFGLTFEDARDYEIVPLVEVYPEHECHQLRQGSRIWFLHSRLLKMVDTMEGRAVF